MHVLQFGSSIPELSCSIVQGRGQTGNTKTSAKFFSSNREAVYVPVSFQREASAGEDGITSGRGTTTRRRKQSASSSVLKQISYFPCQTVLFRLKSSKLTILFSCLRLWSFLRLRVRTISQRTWNVLQRWLRRRALRSWLKRRRRRERNSDNLAVRV